MTLLENMRKAVEAEADERITAAKKAINESDSALKNNSTETRWKQYQSGRITRQQAEAFAVSRAEKQKAKELNAKLAHIENAEKTEVKHASISIMIEWKRSRTWGYNPTAYVTLTAETSAGEYTKQTATGTASGCGYDKESTAVSEALNSLPIIDAELIRAKDACALNDKKMPYGSGYGAMPYIEGGTGMGCVEDVLNACGYQLTGRHNAKTCDYYGFEKRENSTQTND